MPTQVQFRRGNTSQHSTFTGADGEITVDTEKYVVVVHDDTTAGGFAMAPANNATLTGNVNVTGTLGSSLIPTVNNTISLGNTTNRYADLYLSGSSIYLDGQVISANSTVLVLPANTQISGTGDISGLADTAYSNAVSYADTIAGTAYSNATSYTDTEVATAYSNATSYADTIAATAYSNATSYADTIAGTAYSNAVSYTDTAIGTANTAMAANAATAYTNAVAYAASNTYVNETFAPLSGATFTGAIGGTDLTLSGNLTVSGALTYVNTTTLNVGDNIVTLNADLGDNPPSENAGLEVMRGTSANVQLIWNETSDIWTFTNDGSTYYKLASNTDVDTAYSNATSYADTIAGTAYSNAVSYGDSTFATIANPSVTGTLTIDSAVVQDYSTATTTATDEAAVDTFAAATYRSAKYIVQITTGTDYHVTELLVLHDGTTAYVTEYSTIYDNSSLSSFAVDINGGNVRLLATPASATSTVFKIFKTLMVV